MIPEEYLSDENLDKVQMGLAASGMVPGPTGIASDVADAGISIGRGDLLGALLAGGAAIPGIGMAFGARGGRHLGKLRGGKLAQGMLPEEVAMLRHADEGADLERAMTKADEPWSETDELQEIGRDMRTDEIIRESKHELDEFYAELMNLTEGGLGERWTFNSRSGELVEADPHALQKLVSDIEGTPGGLERYTELRSDGLGIEESLIRIQKESPQGEQDLLRQMTEGEDWADDVRDAQDMQDIYHPDPDSPMEPGEMMFGRSSEMTTHEAMEQEAIDRYMKSGDESEIIGMGMTGRDVDAGYFPAGGPAGAMRPDILESMVSDPELKDFSRSAFRIDPETGRKITIGVGKKASPRQLQRAMNAVENRIFHEKAGREAAIRRRDRPAVLQPRDIEIPSDIPTETLITELGKLMMSGMENADDRVIAGEVIKALRERGIRLPF